MFFGSPEHLKFLKYEVLSTHQRFILLTYKVINCNTFIQYINVSC